MADVDLDELAMRLKHGFSQTVRHSDNGENGPKSDPQFWEKYAQWWVKDNEAMSGQFQVGEVIPGYCGGLFPLDTKDDSLRVEAVGVDWVVLRGSDSVHFYEGDPARLRQSAEWALKDAAGGSP